MSAPTDLELMMYHDGELDEARREEVRAYLEAGPPDAPARQKLFGLGLVGAAVQHHAGAPSAVPADLTARIMAAIDAVGPEAVTAPTPSVERGRASRSGSSAKITASSTATANDNGRLIFGLAAAAAAAAAALFIWGRSPPSDAPTASTLPPESTSAPIEARRQDPIPSVKETAPPPEPLAQLDEDGPRSVEVTGVEWGRRSGAILYVPGEGNASSTTVVWVSDE
jgi:hypothetical protein